MLSEMNEILRRAFEAEVERDEARAEVERLREGIRLILGGMHPDAMRAGKEPLSAGAALRDLIHPDEEEDAQ